MSLGSFIRKHKLAIGVTGTTITLGVILLASGIGLAGGLLILGGVGGIGYLVFRANN